jgi:hypothetical protein
LLAILAVGITAASAASAAAPEFLNAAKTGVPTTAITGTTTSSSTLFSKADKTTITCTATDIEGSFDSVTQILGVITFLSCTGNNKKTGKTCEVKSTGAVNVGEIKTNALTGNLGYISKANKEDGLEIKPATGSSFATLEGSCLPATPSNVEGAAVCKVEPVNVAQKEGTLKCAVTAEVQSVKLLEGGKEVSLKVFGLEAALESSAIGQFEELVETTA